MSLDYACSHYEKTETGMVYPNTLAIRRREILLRRELPPDRRYLHDLSGGLVMTLPSESDLRNPECGRYIRKYLYTKPNVDIGTRMRVYNLIRDITADAPGCFGGQLKYIRSLFS